MNGSLVSVIMPVHNSEKYLRESLLSILTQTYENIEVIIVNDGCTDGSMKIVDSFNDQRIRIIQNNENIGLAASLNKAIQSSQGIYLARMDADDISYSRRIEKQILFLDNNLDVDIVGSAMRFIGHSRYVSRFPQSHEECRVQLLFNVCFGHPTVVFRKSVFADPRNLYDESLKQYSEEYELWCRLVSQFRFHNLNEVLLYYRIHGPQHKAETEMLRRRNSLVIQNRYLTLTLGQLTASELAIHARMSMMQEVNTTDDLGECNALLLRMVALNTQWRSFDEKKLANLLALRFFEFCYHNSAVGLASITYYYKSDWLRFYNPSLKLKASHLLKTLLKKL